VSRKPAAGQDHQQPAVGEELAQAHPVRLAHRAAGLQRSRAELVHLILGGLAIVAFSVAS
jgi:hypothetical protein